MKLGTKLAILAGFVGLGSSLTSCQQKQVPANEMTKEQKDKIDVIANSTAGEFNFMAASMLKNSASNKSELDSVKVARERLNFSDLLGHRASDSKTAWNYSHDKNGTVIAETMFVNGKPDTLRTLILR